MGTISSVSSRDAFFPRNTSDLKARQPQPPYRQSAQSQPPQGTPEQSQLTCPPKMVITTIGEAKARIEELKNCSDRLNKRIVQLTGQPSSQEVKELQDQARCLASRISDLFAVSSLTKDATARNDLYELNFQGSKISIGLVELNKKLGDAPQIADTQPKSPGKRAYTKNTGREFGEALANQFKPRDAGTRKLLGNVQRLDPLAATTAPPEDRYGGGFGQDDEALQTEASKLVDQGVISPHSFVISDTGHDIPIMATLMGRLRMSGTLRLPDGAHLNPNTERVAQQAQTWGNEIDALDRKNSADGKVDSYFLGVFGRPDSASACECERNQDASLAQCLHMFNSKEMLDKVKGPRVTALAKDKRPHEERLRELYLTALSRPPSQEELRALLAYLESKKDAQAAYEDIVWVLLNTKEFLFNH